MPPNGVVTLTSAPCKNGRFLLAQAMSAAVEAWAWEQTHGPGCLDTETGGSADLKPLSQTYADQDAFLHDVPRLIIEHNIYGVDIDPRAAQIASLALWLRAQRAWHEAGVKAKHGVTFVSVTQSFNTTTSLGRLTLNILLSFAQFEREVIGERIRDKVAASRKKGIWMGGPVPLGYNVKDRKLIVDAAEAETVRTIFTLYARSSSTAEVIRELDARAILPSASFGSHAWVLAGFRGRALKYNRKIGPNRNGRGSPKLETEGHSEPSLGLAARL